jgi:hypothetical protein
VGLILVAKTLPAATIAVIDPESGTSSGGSSSDVRIAAGDVILFRMSYFPLPDQQIRGLAGYLTEYLPNNTELVGIRFTDANGLTIRPNYPGLANDGCARSCGGFNAVPCTTGAGVGGADFPLCAGGTRNLADGTISGLYGDTGFFYATDAALARNPAAAFITLSNGTNMTAAGDEPTSVASIAPILSTSAPFFVHNAWDYLMVRSYGQSNSSGNPTGNNGLGNTPFGYGSPVAGALTGYRFTSTSSGSAPTIRFDDVVGPWNRIRTPGALVANGTAATGTGTMRRTIADASASGFDVTPLNPVTGARAIRAATGEARAGEPGFVEIAVRVLGTPLDTLLGRDANCAEMFGGDTSARSDTGRARDNLWGLHLGSPGCVFLNNQFELEVDDQLVTGGEPMRYTLRGSNLSTLPQTNVTVTMKYDSTRVAYVFGSATGAPTYTPAFVSNCEGDGLDCIRWTLGTLDPGEDYAFDATFTAGGGGQVTNVMRARYVSTELPGGFGAQAVSLIRAVPVVRLAVDPTSSPTTTFASAGSAYAFSGTLRNDGSGDVSLDELHVVMPSATWRAGSTITINGATFSCSASCATNSPEFHGLGLSLPPGGSFAVSGTVIPPAGTSTGLYDVDFRVWAATMAFGGAFETYFPRELTVPVGAVRSVPPVLDCPLSSASATVPGSSSEANGTNVRAYFNLIQRATGTVSSGRFAASGHAASFGATYGGLEVRATAQASGELESELSTPCYVTYVPPCADGLDNDGDGLVDFPADPGCANAGDNNEANPQCADGLDNDGDGLRDFPADPECSGPDDTTEAGTPACGNGVDDDGDGLVDFPADPGCTSASDRTELQRRACSDGIDNDGDGRIDFGAEGTNDPGCHAENDNSEANFIVPASDVRSRILLVFDTSGSMNWNVCADTFTGGDGSLACAGGDVACATCSATGCGNGVADDSRIFRARRGVADVVAGYGDVEFGLMRFHQRETNFSCPGLNASASSGSWQGAGASPCSGGFAGADLVVGFSPENEYDLLEWMDGDDNYAGTAPPGLDIELRGTGTTPLAGSLSDALAYLDTVRGADTASACRPYRVILLTDGIETCGGSPTTAAAALSAAGYPTSVIGFATGAAATPQLNAIAAAGGTGSAIFADDSVELSAAIADIVNDAIRVEACNGDDDDCDLLVDEGFTRYCNRPGGVADPTLCTDPGETVCDGADDNCNGLVDEGVRNRCGVCGPEPVETCNGLDDDCDGLRDEGGVCAGCTPMPETCNAADDDCDSRIDEGVTRACGTDVGVCTIGVETCVAGVFGPCSGVRAAAESCNNLDDDCDGVVDGLIRTCGSSIGACLPGLETCTAGAFGACVGAIGPSSEICNAIDDDCDGTVDDGAPGAGPCGTDIGACTPGAFQCLGGAQVCVGGTSASPESCNAVDDDCDGRTDEEVPTAGVCGACGAGVLRCVMGMMTCTGDRSPSSEVCNGSDDDCDTRTDEGNPGGGVACGTSEGECSPGLTECRMGAIDCVGDTLPAAEVCNDLDDDCDGVVDEGNPGGGASCGDASVGECAPGIETCRMGAIVCVGGSSPATERCDDRDNDCDGLVDEGNPGGGSACGSDVGECAPGIEACRMGAIVCVGGTEPTDEVCNSLDDDCDGVVDDGIPVGAPCGTDTGECTPGRLECVGGALACRGGVGPATEDCNGLDDDCDGPVDESIPLGDVCGTTEGACVAGRIQCVSGREICVGEVPRAPTDVCNCEDDDCDGAVDEMAFCPGGSSCRNCQCVLPCDPTIEFGPCPSGRIPVEGPDGCFCEAPRCSEEDCAADTIERDGRVFCAPDVPGVPPCECDGIACTFPCEGIVCSAPTVCEPFDGVCVENNCRGLGCAEGEVCNRTTLECEPDPCLEAGCAADEACRDGLCEPSCGGVVCPGGETCRRGVCVEDRCDGVRCTGIEICDPEAGTCIRPMCAGVTCPSLDVCDPLTGTCVRPPCEGLTCPDGERCVEAECVRPEVLPDGGIRDAGTAGRDASAFDGGVRDPETRVLGAGGCMCRAGAATPPGAVATGLVALLLCALGRRRRRRSANAGGGAS